MDEIEEFCNYLTKSVNRRILKLFSRVLELPDDYLWENVQSHGSPTGEGYFRHALFRPVEETTREKSKGLRMHGHTDFGLTTLLFSVPISCLQIWGQDEKWYYVPYKPGALVINIGDTLEIVSGGHFKATRHRVFTPPADQLHEERLSLVLFNSSVGDLRMTPAACEYNLQEPSRKGVECMLTSWLICSLATHPTRRLCRRAGRLQGVQEAHRARTACAHKPSMARDADCAGHGPNRHRAQPRWSRPDRRQRQAHATTRIYGRQGCPAGVKGLCALGRSCSISFFVGSEIVHKVRHHPQYITINY